MNAFIFRGMAAEIAAIMDELPAGLDAREVIDDPKHGDFCWAFPSEAPCDDRLLAVSGPADLVAEAARQVDCQQPVEFQVCPVCGLRWAVKGERRPWWASDVFGTCSPWCQDDLVRSA